VLDAHDAALARRVHELIPANRDADMGCARSHRGEEQQIAGRQPIGVHLLPLAVLLADFARQRQPVLLVDVLNEAAAVEARWIDAAVPVWRAAE
jgi:hypothetical protein